MDCGSEIQSDILMTDLITLKGKAESFLCFFYILKTKAHTELHLLTVMSHNLV